MRRVVATKHSATGDIAQRFVQPRSHPTRLSEHVIFLLAPPAQCCSEPRGGGEVHRADVTIWGTTFALLALAAVGADLNAEWVRHAIRWLRSVQNADGGWGETPASYRNESLAGIGPSMPALTGLALSALIECGDGESPAVLRGIRYLLDEQRPDGAWLNRSYLHTNVPPDTFFELPAAAQFYPLEALGRFQAHRAPDAPQPARAKWNDASLDAMLHC